MMYKIMFEYADSLSNWEWRKQECQLFALDKQYAVMKCKRIYGLGVDCEYRILEVKEV